MTPSERRTIVSVEAEESALSFVLSAKESAPSLAASGKVTAQIRGEATALFATADAVNASSGPSLTVLGQSHISAAEILQVDTFFYNPCVCFQVRAVPFFLPITILPPDFL